MTTTDPVTTIPFIGPKQAQLLSKLGILTVGDLLEYYPVYYKDTSKTVNLIELNRDFKQTVKVTIEDIKNIRIKNGKFIQKGIVSDNTGSCEVTWFNQPYLTKSLKKGMEVLISAKLDVASTKPIIISPEYEVVKEENIHLGRIAPIYPLTKGVSAKWLRTRFAFLVKKLEDISGLKTLPKDIEEKYQLISTPKALQGIHMPKNEDDIVKARKKLAFMELTEIYLKLFKEKQQRTAAKAPDVAKVGDRQEYFKNEFPYELTKSQMKALSEINQDLIDGSPMYRLLQGDVGSGKTIVALLAAVPIMESGYQCVILAPTSVLAKQHYQNALTIFKEHYKISLITAEDSPSNNSDAADLIIATHAILYNKEKYIKNLGLLVIDEQHRFGVEQRRELLELKAPECKPHLLHMTATPIPRSVALTLFGEIDVSIIDKPQGRLDPVTRIVEQDKKMISWEWISEQIKNGGQVFWICPLIEETEEPDDSTIKVLDQTQALKKLWPKFRIEYLHGKLKAKEKDAIIKDFQEGRIDVLVSTTVVEVGIDIPRANIIVIENAERYGLAQLHQLRGRVGRRNQKSWCLLYTPMLDNEKIRSRLTFFSQENSGIKIAEFDLKQRGPGEVYGTIQSGIPQLKIANFGNTEFLALVRQAAQEILNYQIN
ncbi:MAG TPA: ATP-dependent DNA helicase RecG [Candidatus Dojkabacteria bacterium]|nr:ATP-dependent DNA helicase RecG [Candidatus Dojkabacteria bacterium]